jgi:isopenicillin N synthase-like dioxygenase
MENSADLDKCPSATDSRAIHAVPIIDISDLAAGIHRDLASIRKIADACREWGFFQIINHGIPSDVVEYVWKQTRAFFALPVEQKEKVLRTRENPWGYYNNELTKNQRDKKEVFDYTTAGVDAVYRAENRWPDFDGRFRPTLEAYRDACTALSLRLLEAMSASLGLEPQFLNTLFDPEHTGFVRLNYYPVDDPMAGRDDVAHLDAAELGIHHHADAGALTVLLQDSVGGLQVFNNGLWYDVPPIEGALVVNTGDMMQVWSNDHYQAPIHRVLAMDAAERYSIPFFLNPSADARIRPLPSVVSADRPARYRSIEWMDFRSRRTDGDYADYGPEVQIAQFRINE